MTEVNYPYLHSNCCNLSLNTKSKVMFDEKQFQQENIPNHHNITKPLQVHGTAEITDVYVTCRLFTIKRRTCRKYLNSKTRFPIKRSHI